MVSPALRSIKQYLLTADKNFTVLECLKENVLLAPFTTWRVGGVARWYAEPTAENLPELLAFAAEKSLPVYLLGRGSNTLIPDKGVEGLVLHFRKTLQSIRLEGAYLYAEAGVSLPKLSRFAMQHARPGFEFLVGIPGSVGGGIAQNAGTVAYAPRAMSDILDSVDVVTLSGAQLTIPADYLGLSYRHSNLEEAGRIVIGARFHAPLSDDAEGIRKRTLEHLEERKKLQPLDKATAGSTFVNPDIGQSAGYYIEAAGLKGYAIGGARVSPKHANWIENTGNARASDIRKLIEHIQQTVRKRFALDLKTEIKDWGV